MAQYDRNDRNDFGRRTSNAYDRYATERYDNRSGDRFNDRYSDRARNEARYNWERERYNTGPHDDTGRRLTGDWRDDEMRSRGERDDDRGFFERAADTVSSWFGGDDDDRRDGDRRYSSDRDRDREDYYERRFSTEGRGSLGYDRDWNSNFDTRYGAAMEDHRKSHTDLDDNWRRDYNNTASFRNEYGSDSSRRYGSRDSSRNYPERYSRDQEDGREAGRDYYNRLNDGFRQGSRSSYSRSPYAESSSSYGSYGRIGSSNYGGNRYGSSSYGSPNYGSSSNYGSNWSNQSGTYGDNSGSYGSASRGQYTGRGPKNWRRSDDRVKEDVCEYLERNAMIDASDVDITVAEGVVTLTGTVPDRQMKRMCEDEIEHLPGVKDVNNQLRVNRDNDNSESSLRVGSSMSKDSISNSSNDGTSNRSASSNTNGSNGSSRSETNTSTNAAQTGSNAGSTSTRKSGSSVS